MNLTQVFREKGSLHGIVVNYGRIGTFPGRNEFLDKKENKQISEKIETKQKLLFMPNDIREMNLPVTKYKWIYHLVIYGVLQDGRRANVVIEGIRPYFEIELKTDKPSEEIETLMMELKSLTAKNSQGDFKNLKIYDDTEIEEAKPFKYYQTHKNKFVKIYFEKLQHRRVAIIHVREKLHYKTFHDDLSSYERVVCRDYLTTLTAWCEISDYEIKDMDQFKESVFYVNIDNYKKYDGDIINDLSLRNDKTMTMGWDVETHRGDHATPQPGDPSSTMFMICATFQWYFSDKQLVRVCLVDYPCLPHKDFLTIVCGSEKKLIKAFASLCYYMRPEMLIGFNDSSYDWPWVFERAVQYKLITFMADRMSAEKITDFNGDPDSIIKFNYKAETVKLESGMDAAGTSLKFPGSMNIDARTVFRQLYPTAEKSSLAWFLQKNKLGGKEDMPYLEMFRIYEKTRDYIKKNGDLVNKKQIEYINSLGCGEIKTNKLSLEYMGLLTKMRDVSKYCIIDAQRCHELFKIRNVILDRRGVSNVAYTSVYDAFFRANGAKVRNLVISVARQNGFKTSNIYGINIYGKEKYPGGYVVPPERGAVVSKLSIQERLDLAYIGKDNKPILPRALADLNPKRANINAKCALDNTVGKKLPDIADKYGAWRDINQADLLKVLNYIENNGPEHDIKSLPAIEKKLGIKLPKCVEEFFTEQTGRPVTGLDFSSLYPSIIMTFNLSPEYIIRDKKTAKQAQNEGHHLKELSFKFAGEKVRGWSIKHDNKLDKTKPNYKFGVYPEILKFLFDQRSAIKKEMATWGHKKEKMERSEITSEIKEEYETICFNFNYLNSKQKALKVFMNTFYGEAGNKISSFFIVLIAAGTTSIGKQSLLSAQEIVFKFKCRLYYGDTDSIYVSVAEKWFDKLDKLFYSGKISKLEYWTEMVEITFSKIVEVRDAINVWFLESNGTVFLRMAYEEVIFPLIFLAKKKYVGIPHENYANFFPKELFIKGLEIIKRGASQFLIKNYTDILWDFMGTENKYKLLDLVHAKVDYIYTVKWDFNDFAKSYVYKPNKKNISMQTFAARMKARNVEVVPFERLQCVIIKKYPFKFSQRGLKEKLSVGERLEYLDYARENNMEIDMDYYMTGSVNGQLARLITSEPMFAVKPAGDDEEDFKKAWEKEYTNSVNYIKKYATKNFGNYCDKGVVYKLIHNTTAKLVDVAIAGACSPAVFKIIKKIGHKPDIIKEICLMAEGVSKKNNENYGKTYFTARLQHALNKYMLTRKLNISKKDDYAHRRKVKAKVIRTLGSIYIGDARFARRINDTYTARCTKLVQLLHENMRKVSLIFTDRTNLIYDICHIIKQDSNIDSEFNLPGDILDMSNVKKQLEDGNLTDIANETVDSQFATDKRRMELHDLYVTYVNLISTFTRLHRFESIVTYLKDMRDSAIPTRPINFNEKKYVDIQMDSIMSNKNMILNLDL
jgi:DNA polymerase elongation subunit (family B)